MADQLGSVERVTRDRSTVARQSRDVFLLACVLFAIQGLFTVAIRSYVVPKLKPASHWRFGLQRDSDSQYFHQAAVELRGAEAAGDGSTGGSEDRPGGPYVKLLASVYSLFGSAHPRWMFFLNAVLYAVAGCLLYALIRTLGESHRLAVWTGLILSLSPLMLFVHSELLRDTFVINGLLLFVLGLVSLSRPAGSERDWRRRALRTGLAGAGVAIGFVIAATFRPYLMALLLLCLSLTFAVGVLLALLLRGRPRWDAAQAGAFLFVMLVIVAGYVMPQRRRAHQYLEARSFSKETAEEKGIDTEQWRRTVSVAQGTADTNSGTGEKSLTRAHLVAPHWCTVKWQRTLWLPKRVDDRLESLACAREDYLRFCDTAIYGSQVDRNCDWGNFHRAADVAAHLPRSLFFGLFVPFPDMWFSSFGGGGTGLRRAGYVVDGLAAYVLLPGVPLLLWDRRRKNPNLLAVLLGTVSVLTVYAMAVPTQFILARMRLGLFLPLLVLGALGWAALARWIGFRHSLRASDRPRSG